MPEVACRRCGDRKPGLDAPPFRGALGEEVAGNVCAACWRAWLDEQTIQMNERRLSLARTDHQDLVRNLMREFLRLG